MKCNNCENYHKDSIIKDIGGENGPIVGWCKLDVLTIYQKHEQIESPKRCPIKRNIQLHTAVTAKDILDEIKQDQEETKLLEKIETKLTEFRRHWENSNGL